MKVVIFCGGLGLRMRSGVDSAPKPMMTIGDRPVLWHVMRYYAHFGHTEFILCLGFGGSVGQGVLPATTRRPHSNDFVHDQGRRADRAARLGHQRMADHLRRHRASTPSIGERLRRVRPYLEDDEVFLANYGDVLTDAPMDTIVDQFVTSDAVGQPARGSAPGVLPRGRVRDRRPDRRAAVRRRPDDVDQRRLLRAAAG